MAETVEQIKSKIALAAKKEKEEEKIKVEQYKKRLFTISTRTWIMIISGSVLILAGVSYFLIKTGKK
jgi:hypothetical protein